jgi:hypothetical protein
LVIIKHIKCPSVLNGTHIGFPTQSKEPQKSSIYCFFLWQTLEQIYTEKLKGGVQLVEIKSVFFKATTFHKKSFV